MSRYDNSQVFASVGKGIMCASESSEYRVKKNHAHDGYNGVSGKSEEKGICEYKFDVTVFAAEKKRGQRSCTDADQHAESRHNVHERESESKTGKGKSTDTLTNKDTVYNIVERIGQGAYQRWESKTPNQSGDRIVC